MLEYSALVFGSIAYLVQHYAGIYLQEDMDAFLPKVPLDYSLPVIETYDFIVVGGGTAGCVVASRLSENANFQVLLLEIGGNPPPHLEVPAFMGKFLSLPEVAFQYRSVPQEFTSRAYNNGSLVVRVGKVLGGTSGINAMFFNRGHPLDYDNWANLTNDLSWKYENLLPYFKMVEAYSGAFPLTDEHGSGGSVPISKPTFVPGLSLWLEAGKELGYQNRDPNGPQNVGLSPIEFTKRNGRRVSSFDAYLKHNEERRPNLKIIRYAHVEQVLLDEKKNAVGVKYVKHGVTQVARVSKELILSAGTYGTPQILLKSGIGSKAKLSQANINQEVELEGVGANLMDHPLVPLRIIINDTSIIYDEQRDVTEESVQDFLRDGSGPLSSDKSVVGQGFIVTSQAVEDGFSEWPDIQFSLYSQDFQQLPVPKPSDLTDNETSIFILPYLGRPRSTGTFDLNHSDTSQPPLIDFKFLSEPTDIKAYIEGINKSLSIFEKTEAYGKVGARYSPVPVPQCECHEFRSDAYWTCYLLHFAFVGNHPVGTSRMGTESDPRTVVNSKLKVIGVPRLRVIDASVMPVIPNSNTQAGVYMIAEKISAEILREWTEVTSSGAR